MVAIFLFPLFFLSLSLSTLDNYTKDLEITRVLPSRVFALDHSVTQSFPGGSAVKNLPAV